MSKLAKSEIGQYVVFSIQKQLYSLPIDEVIEILRRQTITNVPGIKEHIEGVINLRGKILPVVNLLKRFSMPASAPDKKSRIVVVQGEQENIGIMVDEVRMVTHVDTENIEPPPGIHLEQDCFKGFAKIDDEVIGVLNLQKVLSPDQ